jgi:site-specific recombinase
VNYNEALIKYGTQPLQRAIDEVAAEMTEHYMAKDMREMAAAFNAIR